MEHPDPTTHALSAGAAPPAVHEHVTRLMRARSIPGLSLAVTDRERLLFAAGYGAATLRPVVPATATTAYRWFSLSKVVTATAAVRLAEEGRLDLDAPCGEHLGQRPGTGPTARQLLSHTSGARNPLPLRWVHPAAGAARDEELLARLLRRHPLPEDPGTVRGRYSNMGYLALGQVISAAAGRPFPQYVREGVLDPAGMVRTGYADAPGSAPATGYVKGPRGTGALLRAALPRGVVGRRHGVHVALQPFLVDGAAYGGLVGDVTDAARFVRLHLRNGEIDGHRVLSAGGARSMREVRHPGRPFDHGLAWFRRRDADTTRPDHVEHYGAGAGYWNAMRLYPDLGLGVVVMANTTAAYDVDTLFDLLRQQQW